MSQNNLVDKVNEIATDFEQFKHVNERKIQEIKQKGRADPLTENQLNAINNHISDQTEEIEKLKVALNRPAGNGSGSGSDSEKEDENIVSSMQQSTEYKQEFCKYLRKGNESGLQSFEQKSLANHVDFDSGYLITSKMSYDIERELMLNSPIRKISNVTSISTDALEILDENSELSCGWTNESTDYNSTTDIKLCKKIIPVHELFVQPRVTQKILDDRRIDVEHWLAHKLQSGFGEEENKAFLHGDGKGKPEGLLNYAANNKEINVKNGDKSQIKSDSILNMYYALKETYSIKAKFLLSRSTLQNLRMMKENHTGRYMWQPNMDGKGKDTLLGAEVIECAEMPKMAPNNFVMVLADFKSAYQIVDRHDIRILRDPYTDKPFVKYYATKKVGGGVLNPNAIRVMHMS